MRIVAVSDTVSYIDLLYPDVFFINPADSLSQKDTESGHMQRWKREKGFFFFFYDSTILKILFDHSSAYLATMSLVFFFQRVLF